MGYLQEFKTQIRNNNYPGLLQLWEEYCGSEIVDGLELRDILQAIKESDQAAPFGAYVDLVVDLWKTIEDEQLSHAVLKLIVDLQTTNSEQLAELTYSAVNTLYGKQKFFGEKIRLIGLRSRDSFQGALTNYELLTHLNKGRFVYHTGGWGTGEILEISLVREELILEFENVIGKKDFTFKNAFKHLIPLEDDHFLAQRFGNPDKLEACARKDPIELLHLLLRDLGPLTASEIKDEVCELVIPEEDWTKWWQSARSKSKKDTKIDTPSSIKEPFRLRDTELSHEERFKKQLGACANLDKMILTVYNFVRDFSEQLKNADLRDFLQGHLEEALVGEPPNPAQTFQIFSLLESVSQSTQEERVSGFIQELEDIEGLVASIDIIAFKKRALLAVRQFRDDWPETFLHLIFITPQAPLRDYLLKELNKDITREQFKEKMLQLVQSPTDNPETIIWYFQRLVAGEDIPFSNRESLSRFFEAFLVLMSKLESDSEQRDLVKKMVNILSAKRWEVVRSILQGTKLETVQEFLLLASKCQSFADYELKTLHSLAAVEHPSLASKIRAQKERVENVLWTTEQGYNGAADRIKHLSQVEVVENAKEIEAARALGDLRENSEYKFALEKRSRIQSELKRISDDLNRARIITPSDISLEETGAGNTIELKNSSGTVDQYTLLGPWDADPEKKILSLQSAFAQAMSGKKQGDSFEFQDETFTVTNINSFLEG